MIVRALHSRQTKNVKWYRQTAQPMAVNVWLYLNANKLTSMGV